ncbi:MAG: glycosyltransferase family 2 protein [Candidatus Cryptobacteroides sp.]
MNNKLVSIITPCYNSAKYIGQMIESVQSQTYTNWELLITDDCSTDNSKEIIDSYIKSDPRIKYFKLNTNSGAGIARNNSIEKAVGRYIAFCDSDDMWRAEKLEKQIRFMQDNNYEFCHCNTLVIDENNNIVGLNKKPKRVSFHSTRIINYIGTSSVIYDTERVGKFYMKPIRKRQDFALWLNILQATKYAYCLEEPLFIYRYTQGSISSNKCKLLKYHIDVYRQALGYSKLHAYLLFYCVSFPCFVMKKLMEKVRETFFNPNSSKLSL